MWPGRVSDVGGTKGTNMVSTESPEIEAILERKRQRRLLPDPADRRLRRALAGMTQREMAEAVLATLRRRNPHTGRESLSREAVSRWEAPAESKRGREPREDLLDAYLDVLTRLAGEVTQRP